MRCKDGAFGLPNCLKTIIMVIAPFECILNTCSNVLITISRIIAPIRHASCARYVCAHRNRNYFDNRQIIDYLRTSISQDVLYIVAFQNVHFLFVTKFKRNDTRRVRLVGYCEMHQNAATLEYKWVFAYRIQIACVPICYVIIAFVNQYTFESLRT